MSCRQLAFVTASTVALAYALQQTDGFYAGAGLTWVTAAIGLAVAGTLISTPGDDKWHWRVIFLTVACAGLGWQIAALLGVAPTTVPKHTDLGPFKIGIAVEGVLLAISLLPWRVIRVVAFVSALGAHSAIGTWVFRASPSPVIDVVPVHNAAIDALARGRSPYRIRFENPYGPRTEFYAPELIAGGKIRFGYPYPPLPLLVAAPARWWLGDYRYAWLAAIVAAAALLGFGAGPYGMLAAGLLLTHPRGWFVLDQGWIEPLLVALVASTTVGLMRTPRAAGVPAGLLLVAKQYMPLAAPLLWRALSARTTSRAPVVLAIATAALVTLPFLIRDRFGFIEYVVLLQGRQPFRADSLSYLSWAARAGLGEGSMIWSVAAAAAVLPLCWRRTPATPAATTASLGLMLLVTFAMGSKAFCNYYYLVIGTLCCAIAAAEPPVSPRRGPLTPPEALQLATRQVPAGPDLAPQGIQS